MVNYRNDAESKAFLRDCLQIPGAEQGHFVLVNNSASSAQDPAFEELLRLSPRVSVLNCPDNPGYFGAGQSALRSFYSESLKFVILSNSDLKILTPDFYQRLLGFSWGPQVGAIAPSIFSELTRQESNPLYWQRPSTQKIQFLRWIYSNFALAWLYHLGSTAKGLLQKQVPWKGGGFAYAPHGCFLILTENYLKNGGDFSYPIRLYGEEIHLAERLRGQDLKVLLSPELRIVHREKGTEVSWLHRLTLSPRTFRFKQEAAIYLEQLFRDG